MSESDDCLFCKIIAGQIPSSKVYEDETTYAFNDINPKVKVHVLVVPTKHYANVAELAAGDPTELAHIVSSAYIKSPEAQRRRGFSAGSFQDMTRVARLDEDMWTELFLDDADYLTTELDELIVHLREYADAIRARDAQALRALLRDGREKKASAGGN